MAIIPDPDEYLRSLSQELQSKANRVRHLIGDKHFLTDGHHKEYVLQSMLERFLPAGLVCGRGFVVRDQALTMISHEQDLLVVDVRRYAPLFYESGVIVTFPENVRAAISIKSTLSSGTLDDAVQGLNSIPRIDALHSPWLGVFAFTLHADWSDKLHLPIGWLRERQQELFEHWAEGGVCVDGVFYARLNRRETNNLRGYDTRLSAALFLSALLQDIQSCDGSHSRGMHDLMSGTDFQEIV